jgi:hypothetical protein
MRSGGTSGAVAVAALAGAFADSTRGVPAPQARANVTATTKAAKDANLRWQRPGPISCRLEPKVLRMNLSQRLLVTALLAATGCTHTTVRAVLPNPNEPAHGVTVSGQGEAKAAPNIAKANLGVEVRAETAEQATADVNARMAAVIAALKQAGVADKDLRTSNLSIGFEQEQQPPVVVMPAPAARGKAAEAAPQPAPEASTIRGHYRATNMVEATIRDMNAIGRLLKLATDAGANNVWGIQFEIEDPQPIRAQARAQAIERAKQNAADLARLSGVKLGKLIAINESDGGGYQPMMKSVANEMRQAADAPVEKGEITVNHQVQLLFALE